MNKIYFALLILILSFLLLSCSNVEESNDYSNDYNEEIDVINKINYDVVVYGEHIAMTDDLAFRHVNDITEDTLYIDGEFDYRLIVINNVNCDCPLSIEQAEKLKKFVDKYKYNIYIATDNQKEMLNFLTESNILPSENSNLFREDDLSFIYNIFEDGNVCYGTGLWNQRELDNYSTNEYVLIQCIIYSIYIDIVNSF